MVLIASIFVTLPDFYSMCTSEWPCEFQAILSGISGSADISGSAPQCKFRLRKGIGLAGGHTAFERGAGNFYQVFQLPSPCPFLCMVCLYLGRKARNNKAVTGSQATMKINSSIWDSWLNSEFTESGADRSEAELSLLKPAASAPPTRGHSTSPSRTREHGFQLLEAAGIGSGWGCKVEGLVLGF